MIRKTLAAFDFDGTLINGDSLLMFARFVRGRCGFLWAFVRSVPDLIAWKTGFISNSVAKERLFARLYCGMDYEVFTDAGRRFCELLERKVRPEVLERLESHLAAGTPVVIVTASMAEWVGPWAMAHGVDNVIATEPEVGPDGKLTGRFASPNCHGEEKVRRLRAAFPDWDEYETWAYGDSSGDGPMLASATHSLKV